MKFADRVKETMDGASTSTVTITLQGALPGYRTFSSAFTTSTSGICVCVTDTAGNWEIGSYTLATSTMLVRNLIISSSNNNAAVTFTAGSKDVFCTVTSEYLSSVSRVRDVPFSAQVPLTEIGTAYMTQQRVSDVLVGGALTFAPAAAAVRGALVYLRLIGDGVTTPNFSAFKEWGGSVGYDKRADIVNELQFFYDGYDYWYSASQAVGATATDTTAPTVNGNVATVSNSTPNTVNFVMSEPMSSSYKPAASAFTVSGHTVTDVTIVGSTMALTLGEPFVYGEPARTVTYLQPATNGARDVTGNLLASFPDMPITNYVAAVDNTAPVFSSVAPVSTNSQTQLVLTFGEPLASINPANSAITMSGGRTVSSIVADGTTVTVTFSPAYAYGDSITFNYVKPASSFLQDAAGNPVGDFGPTVVQNNIPSTITAPGTPTIGTPIAGDGYIDVYFTPGSTGGATVTYTATLSTGESNTGAASPIRVTCANGTSRTAHVTATNSVGPSAASAESISVMPQSSGESITMVSRQNTTASSGVYTGTLTGQSFGVGTPSGGITSKAFLPGTDGSFSFRVAALSTAGTGANEIVAAVGPNDFAPDRTYMTYCIWVRTTGYLPVLSGTQKAALNSVPAAVGDIVKFERVGTNLAVSVSKDGQNYTPIYNFTVPTDVTNYGQIRFTNQAAVDTLVSSGLGTPVKTAMQLTTKAGITEGGTAGAYTYTGNSTVAAYSAGQAGLADKAFTTATNGSISVPIISLGTGKCAVVTSANAALSAPTSTYIGITSDAPYAAYYLGASNGNLNSVTPANGDILRITRQGTATRVSVSQDGGQSFTLIKEYTSGNNTSNNIQIFLTGTTQIGPITGTGVA